MYYAVIMAGGSGTRFWPVSRRSFPKQLIRLTGRRSLLQDTVDRFSPLIPPEKILIVTSETHVDPLRGQVPQIPEENILVEPVGRNTAPCIGLAAMHIRKREPEARFVAVPADHVITDRDTWHQLLRIAFEVAATPGRVLTFGIPPTHPETGFGYIRFGESVASCRDRPVHRVTEFIEKPDASLARQLVESGDCYWNSGVCAARAATMLDLIQLHLPEVMTHLEAIGDTLDTPQYESSLQTLYPHIPSISIDHGILEKAERVVSVPANMGWSDVGSWSALPEVLPGDDCGTVAVGEHVSIDAWNCVTYGEGKLIATVGVEDLIVVAAGDTVLVCHKDRAQDVRGVVDELERRGHIDWL